VSTAVASNTDRCELCGVRIETAARGRIRHLRRAHPAYARSVLLRVAAPGVFLIEVLILAALQAPTWTFVVALVCSLGVLLFGKLRSRAERERAGVRATLPFGRLLREGGLGILLLVPIVAIIVAALGR
jgi:hypothetical protein